MGGAKKGKGKTATDPTKFVNEVSGEWGHMVEG